MTVKVSESDSQLVSVPTSESAPWTNLIQSSVPGLSFLFEVTGKPWTAGLGVLGLVLAATIAGLLGFGGGMRDRVRGSENYNYCKCKYDTQHLLLPRPLVVSTFCFGEQR